MDVLDAMQPVFQTEQFDVFCMTCARNSTVVLRRCTPHFIGIRMSHSPLVSAQFSPTADPRANSHTQAVMRWRANTT